MVVQYKVGRIHHLNQGVERTQLVGIRVVLVPRLGVPQIIDLHRGVWLPHFLYGRLEQLGHVCSVVNGSHGVSTTSLILELRGRFRLRFQGWGFFAFRFILRLRGRLNFLGLRWLILFGLVFFLLFILIISLSRLLRLISIITGSSAEGNNGIRILHEQFRPDHFEHDIVPGS